MSSGQAALQLRGAQPHRAWAATSSRCRSSTARRTRCSRTCCRARASTVRFAESDQPDAIEQLIDDNTRAVFCESVGNPAGNICDIEALAEVAHAARRSADRRQHRGDADPAAADRLRRRHRRALADQVHGRPRHDARRRHRRQRPVSRGRQHARALSDVQRAGRRPITAWSTPSISATAAYIARCRSVYQRTTGAVLSPLSAFLLLQGIETVALRVERHVENARRVAEFLRDDPRVEWVNYAGFRRQPLSRAGAEISRRPRLLAADVRRRGGFEAGKRFYDALKLVKRLVNMGDAKSLACHPASTTHRQMSPEEQRKAGVTPGDDPAQHRHRAHRRHHRRSRSGAGRGADAARDSRCIAAE